MGFCVDPWLDPETHVSDNGEVSSAHSYIVAGRMQAIRDYVSRSRRLEHSAEQALAGA
jgi:hypothetical protein